MTERLRLILVGAIGALVGLGLFIGGGWYVASVHDAHQARSQADALRAEVKGLKSDLRGMTIPTAGIPVAVKEVVTEAPNGKGGRTTTTTRSSPTPTVTIIVNPCDPNCQPCQDTCQPQPCTPPTPPEQVCGPVTSLLSPIRLPGVIINTRQRPLAAQGVPPQLWATVAVAVALAAIAGLWWAFWHRSWWR